MHKKTNLTNLQIKTLSIVAGFLFLTALGVGSVNYIDNNSYLFNQAKAVDDTGSTAPVNPGGVSLGLPTPSSASTTSNSSSTSGSTSGSSSSGTSTTTTNVSTSTTTTDNQTPSSLPSGQGDVLTINKNNTITSSSTTTPTSSTTQNTVPASLNTTVRTGGLEVTLASVALLLLIGFAYYYKRYGNKKSLLKTTEKKISHK
jgi:cytoskeletal protein RodZ